MTGEPLEPLDPRVDLEITLIRDDLAVLARHLLRSGRLAITPEELADLQRIGGKAPRPGPYVDGEELG